MLIRQASNMGNHKQRLISNIKKIQKTGLIFLVLGLAFALSGCDKPIFIERYKFALYNLEQQNIKVRDTGIKLNDDASIFFYITEAGGSHSDKYERFEYENKVVITYSEPYKTRLGVSIYTHSEYGNPKNITLKQGSVTIVTKNGDKQYLDITTIQQDPIAMQGYENHNGLFKSEDPNVILLELGYGDTKELVSFMDKNLKNYHDIEQIVFEATFEGEYEYGEVREYEGTVIQVPYYDFYEYYWGISV